MIAGPTILPLQSGNLGQGDHSSAVTRVLCAVTLYGVEVAKVCPIKSAIPVGNHERPAFGVDKSSKVNVAALCVCGEEPYRARDADRENRTPSDPTVPILSASVGEQADGTDAQQDDGAGFGGAERHVIRPVQSACKGRSITARRVLVDVTGVIVRHEEIAAAVECQAQWPVQSAGKGRSTAARRKLVDMLEEWSDSKKPPLLSNAKPTG